MPYAAISSRVTITGSSSFVTQVTALLTTIYEGSGPAAVAINLWLNNHPTENLEIKFVANKARAYPGLGIVEIDPAFFSGNYYLSTNGRAVMDTFLSGLTHELGHAVTGNIDNDSFSDLAGDNVRTVNQWFAPLAIAAQACYEAYDVGPQVLVPGMEYTDGNAITNAIVDRGSYSTQNGFSFNSTSVDLTVAAVSGSTLIVGSSAENIYRGTADRDWIYGNGGNDIINGGQGDDFLYGGADNDHLGGEDGDDILASGSGSDFIDGGAGTDTIDIEREISAGGASFSIRGLG